MKRGCFGQARCGESRAQAQGGTNMLPAPGFVNNAIELLAPAYLRSQNLDFKHKPTALSSDFR